MEDLCEKNIERHSVERIPPPRPLNFKLQNRYNQTNAGLGTVGPAPYSAWDISSHEEGHIPRRDISSYEERHILPRGGRYPEEGLCSHEEGHIQRRDIS